MEKITAWDQFKKLINSKGIGDTISRQEIIRYCDCSDINCDYMRNLSETVGILQKHKNKNGKIISGIFIVMDHIKENLTVSQLRNEYDCTIQARFLKNEISAPDSKPLDKENPPSVELDETNLKYGR